MLNSPIIDVAIGLVFCFAALALTVSTVTEAISSALKWRSTALFASVKALLNDQDFKGLALDVFNHALVSPMHDGRTTAGGTPSQLPSYIPAHHFATALVDVIQSVPGDFQTLRQDIDQLQDAQLRGFLQSAYAKAALQAAPLVQFETFHRHIGDWFDNSMERASGAYKRRSQAWTFGIAFVIAVAFNVDSIYLLKVLWLHPALTAGISNPGAAPQLTGLLAQMRLLPVGWSGREYAGPFDIAAAAAGLAVTAVTAVFGAPFWFDALQRLIRLRGTGMKPKAPVDRDPP